MSRRVLSVSVRLSRSLGKLKVVLLNTDLARRYWKYENSIATLFRTRPLGNSTRRRASCSAAISNVRTIVDDRQIGVLSLCSFPLHAFSLVQFSTFAEKLNAVAIKSRNVAANPSGLLWSAGFFLYHWTALRCGLVGMSL